MQNRKAQNIIEYVLLFVIVATAITITNRYISRSMSARLKQIQEELSYKNDR
jgi:Flp pilus assembly pilin Flp